METTVAVRGLGITKVFGDVVALDHVDLNVARGRIHGLVGPNGAGKTTLLGLLLGLAVADEGRLEIFGGAVGRSPAAPGTVSGFVDGPGPYPTLTAKQNLAVLAGLRHRDAPSAGIGEVLEQVGLTAVADDKVRGFSLGMRQRLGLAAALLTKPQLLVLDEPANGLDPAGKKHVHGVLNQLVADGATVILSSHRMDDLEALCSEVTILSTGRVVFSGPLHKLSDENRELEYRLRTSDPSIARTLAQETPGVAVVEGADVALRELAPVVSPLEAAFLLPVPVAVRLALPGYAFISWNGLFTDPQQLQPLLIGIAVSLVWAVVATVLAYLLFLRRDFTNLTDDGAGRKALTLGVLPLAGVLAVSAGVVAVTTGAGGSGIDQDKVQKSVATAFAHLYVLQEAEMHRPSLTESPLQTSAICSKSEGHGAQEGSGNDWRCTVSWHVPGSALTGQSIYQLDVTANGRYIADGDGPQEVNGYFLVRTDDGDVPNPLWQFDGNVDLLPTH
ncbi:ABC-type multidrug transport system ATPase subunit [Catenulispora sp. MAP12-49]|uniref:ABC transporter ATP-binding protein n=1 Tax=Catenulispora sp. MAP12-49 TaxID=3156302 RepID=UPI003516F460